MSESEELGKLGDLHQRGVLSDDEFARAKARVLSGASRQAHQTAAASAINAFRRSVDDRWLGGVCGGIARLTESPSWIWRLLFTLLVVCAGTGALLYVLLWFFVPTDAPQVQRSQAAS
jgi:phage shock protein PspC (stress-responsive transcriptional regulator)